MKNLRKIQAEQAAWALANFGQQPPWHHLVGMYEEFGEFSETITDFELVKEQLELVKGGKKSQFNFDLFRDALGDIMVYACGFATAMDWSLQTLWDERPNPSRDYVRIVVAFGKMSHHFLKSNQKIRGDAEKHNKGAQKQFKRILAELHGMAEVAEMDLVEILNEVWEKVSKRDWKKNPDAPAVELN